MSIKKADAKAVLIDSFKEEIDEIQSQIEELKRGKKKIEDKISLLQTRI